MAENITLESLQLQLEKLEHVVINLMNGYAELTVIVEGMFSQVLNPMDEEARKQFILEVKQGRKDMFDLMRKAATGVAETVFTPPATVANLDVPGRIDLAGTNQDSGPERTTSG